MTKKIVTGFLAVFVLSALALSGCAPSGNPEKSGTESGSVSPSGSSETQLLGGWTINSDYVPVLTEESEKAFQDALVGYTGMNLKPVTLLATQVVAGTNFLYLCQGEAVTAEPHPGWYLVVVYRDLEGKAQFSSVEKLNVTDLKTTEKTPEANLAGGWTLMPPSNTVTLSEEALSAFNQATVGYTGVTLSPLALLATQVVAGKNYMIFCHGTMVTAEPLDSLYIATVYVNPEGKAELSDVQQLDYLAYLK